MKEELRELKETVAGIGVAYVVILGICKLLKIK